MGKTMRSDRVWVEGGDADFYREQLNSGLGGDNRTIDAFARIRVSEGIGLFDSQQQYDASPLVWQSKITNASGNAAVTHLPNESSVRLTVEAGDTIVRQTRAYIRYQPGKSQLIMMTFAPAASKSGLTQRFGYFDASNGIFLQESNGALSIVQRSNATGTPVDQVVAQSDWNVDKLNGSGISGKTLDFTKAQILLIDLEWLGVGRVRVGFVIDGVIDYVHEFLNANAFDSVYMSTANLPVRYEVTGAAGMVGSSSVKQICSQVSSEGGVDFERGYLFSASNGVTTISVTTRRPILSIRPRATFNAQVNRIAALIESVTLHCSANAAFVELVYGGTLTGASWANVNTDHSSVERDIAATAIAGGVVIHGDYIPASAQGNVSNIGRTFLELVSRYPLTLDIDGNHPTTPFSDAFTVVATSIPGAAASLSASMTWREPR